MLGLPTGTFPGHPKDVRSLKRSRKIVHLHPGRWSLERAGISCDYVSGPLRIPANPAPTISTENVPKQMSAHIVKIASRHRLQPPRNNVRKITPQNYTNHLLAGSHANTQRPNSNLDGRWGEPPDISANSEDKSLGAAESRSELNPPRRPLGGRWASSNPVADITSFELGDLISLRPGHARPISKSAPVLS